MKKIFFATPRHILFILLFLIISCSSVRADIVTGLVGHWKLDGNGNDSSGRGNNGTVTNATATPDRSNVASKAMAFDGNGDYITCTDANLPLGNANRTISLWIKPSVSESKQMFGYGGEGAGKLFTVLMVATSNIVGIWWYGNSLVGQFPTTVVSLGVWQNIVFTYDGTNIRSYLNGSLKDSYAIALNTLNTGTMKIGDAPNVTAQYRYFNGSIDDVRIYNRALTQDDVTQLYNNGAATKLQNATLRGAVLR